MSFFCRNCQLGPSEFFSHPKDSSVVRKSQPFKLRLLSSLGLMQPLIHKYVLNRECAPYHFSRKQLLFLDRQGCNIPLLYFPLPSPKHSTVIVYSHGNGSNLNHIHGMARKLHEMYGVAVVAYDYTGYGESTKEGGSFEDDIKTVLAWVVQQGYPVGRIVLAGFSLGSYPTLLLDAAFPRVLIAPITGLTSFVQGEVAHYENEPLDNIVAARRLSSRVFMVHSKDDSVSIDHSRVLYQAFTEGRTFQARSRINYIETTKLKHDQMPNFFVQEENNEFLKFLTAVKHDNEQSGGQISCERTLQLLSQLKQISEETTVLKDNTTK